MAILLASVLDADWNDLENEVKMVDDAGIDGFSLDIMDGKFVERTTFDMDTVRRIRMATNRPIEAHLMVESPEEWMEEICEAGVDQLLFHIEATEKPLEILDYVQGRDLSCGIAVLIETPIESLPTEVMRRVDIVNLMAVRVGYGGQKASEQTEERIRQLREIFGCVNDHFAIGVDGGMKIDNCADFAGAGADLILMGTGIYRAPDRAQAVAAAREYIKSDDPVSRERLKVFLQKNHLLINGDKECTD